MRPSGVGGAAGPGVGGANASSVGGANASSVGGANASGAGGGLGAAGGGPGVSAGAGGGPATSAGGGPAVGSGGANPLGGAPGSNGGNGASTSTGGAPDGGGGGSGTCRVFETVPGGTIGVPTVFLLVDRSGSMFSCADAPSAMSTMCADPTKTIWSVLRTSLLDVVQQLQGRVRFGFGAFTGNASAASCPIFDGVPAALDNQNAIASLYAPLGPLGVKAETPVGAALDKVKAIFAADTSPGPKYILFVTDGQPDFCDDGNSLCPVDSVVAHLQALRASGITTLVFGIQNGLSAATMVPIQTLQAFANAGAGQPVVQLTDPVTTTADMCVATAGWVAERNAAGLPARTPLGTYATSGGAAAVYKPDPMDQAALGSLLLGTVAGVKSCTFDLANGLFVDLGKVDQAKVTIEAMAIARDDANGWRMSTKTQLVLSGTACELWRQPASHSIDFQFPCGVIMGP